MDCDHDHGRSGKPPTAAKAPPKKIASKSPSVNVFGEQQQQPSNRCPFSSSSSSSSSLFEHQVNINNKNDDGVVNCSACSRFVGDSIYGGDNVDDFPPCCRCGKGVPLCFVCLAAFIRGSVAESNVHDEVSDGVEVECFLCRQVVCSAFECSTRCSDTACEVGRQFVFFGVSSACVGVCGCVHQPACASVGCAAVMLLVVTVRLSTTSSYVFGDGHRSGRKSVRYVCSFANIGSKRHCMPRSHHAKQQQKRLGAPGDISKICVVFVWTRGHFHCGYSP